MMTFTTVRINVNASCQTLHQTEIGIIIAAEMVRYKRMATNGVKISTMFMNLATITLMTTMAVTLMTTMVVTPTTTTMGTTQLKSKKFKKRKREI